MKTAFEPLMMLSDSHELQKILSSEKEITIYFILTDPYSEDWDTLAMDSHIIIIIKYILNVNFVFA